MAEWAESGPAVKGREGMADVWANCRMGLVAAKAEDRKGGVWLVCGLRPMTRKGPAKKRKERGKGDVEARAGV